MHSALLPPAMCKYKSKLGTLSLAWQPVSEKENSESRSVKLHLKFDIVWCPACEKGLVYTYSIASLSKSYMQKMPSVLRV